MAAQRLDSLRFKVKHDSSGTEIVAETGFQIYLFGEYWIGILGVSAIDFEILESGIAF